MHVVVNADGKAVFPDAGKGREVAFKRRIAALVDARFFPVQIHLGGMIHRIEVHRQPSFQVGRRNVYQPRIDAVCDKIRISDSRKGGFGTKGNLNDGRQLRVLLSFALSRFKSPGAV